MKLVVVSATMTCRNGSSSSIDYEVRLSAINVKGQRLGNPATSFDLVIHPESEKDFLSFKMGREFEVPELKHI